MRTVGLGAGAGGVPVTGAAGVVVVVTDALAAAAGVVS